MGGEIYIESEVGKGSKFYFSVSFKNAPNTEVTPEENEISQRSCLLYVTQSPKTFSNLQQTLEAWNLKCKLVNNVESFSKELNTLKPDVLFIDHIASFDDLLKIQTAIQQVNFSGKTISVIPYTMEPCNSTMYDETLFTPLKLRFFFFFI